MESKALHSKIYSEFKYIQISQPNIAMHSTIQYLQNLQYSSCKTQGKTPTKLSLDRICGLHNLYSGKSAELCKMDVNMAKCECVEKTKHTCRRSSLDAGPLSHSRSLLHKRWHAVHQNLSFPCYRYETSSHRHSL